jgi:dihydrodipicolinate synthase/N-acetylneuraminate lyase
MDRRELLHSLVPDTLPALWVPLLTSYRIASAGTLIDDVHMRAHAARVGGSVPLWMVAGSTGDGWNLDDAQYDALMRLAADGLRACAEARVLVALLRGDTAGVLELIDRLHRIAGTRADASLAENTARLRALGWVGICVCPPVGAATTQAQIRNHYEAVLERARMPLALYQLPQVTACRIEPATYRELVTAHVEIIMFKDTSGEDTIAHEVPGAGPLLVRGAEGGYAQALAALGGAYDGFLLSTANVFGAELRQFMLQARAGRSEDARALGARLEARIMALFEAGTGAPIGNVFSNTNRAIAHILEHGRSWRDQPLPMLFDGSRLPRELVDRVAHVLARTA